MCRALMNLSLTTRDLSLINLNMLKKSSALRGAFLILRFSINASTFGFLTVIYQKIVKNIGVLCLLSSTLIIKRLIIQKNMVKYYYINVKKIFHFLPEFV